MLTVQTITAREELIVEKTLLPPLTRTITRQAPFKVSEMSAWATLLGCPSQKSLRTYYSTLLSQQATLICLKGSSL